MDLTKPLSAAAVIGALLLSGACASGKRGVRTAPQAAPPSVAAGRPAQAGPAAPPSLPVLEKDDLNGEAPADRNGNGSLDKDESAAALEDALNSYQEGQAALDRGDLDAALAKLDEAYGLILKARVPADSPLCQEKNDLRILIAQRIQQAYASRLPSAGAMNKSIPLAENPWVQKEIESFQTKERGLFEEAYKRAGLYRPMILDEFRKAGLPEQLSWLPMIESWFKVRALSRARALGLWQFISSTGYRYGLRRDKYVDERMDPLKSTQAAARYLTELHDLFGEWTTALASYNCGEFRVQNTIRSQRVDYLDNFWDLFQNLPYETARFVPRFIAALHIITDPAKYGFTLPEPDPPLVFETVTVEQPVKLAVLSAQLGLDPLMLSFLNPELRNDSTPNAAYSLKVPAGYGEKVSAALPAVPRWIPPDVVFSWHSVRNGETLGAIARRYRTTVAAIQRLNNLRNSTLIRPGQKLRIPGRGGAPAEETGASGASSGSVAPAAPRSGAQASQIFAGNREASTVSPGTPQVPISASGRVIHNVKPGDTLFALARTYRTSIDRIRKANGLRNDSLAVGQALTIPSNRI